MGERNLCLLQGSIGAKWQSVSVSLFTFDIKTLGGILTSSRRSFPDPKSNPGFPAIEHHHLTLHSDSHTGRQLGEQR